MPFCSNCGQEIISGAKFCSGCGTPTISATNESQRKVTYEGEMHKCPNCGEFIGAFIANCPSCGYELRGAKAVSSVKKLSEKLEQIEAQEMPILDNKKSVLKTVFGRDFKNEDALEEERRQFEEQKQKRKANLIINYSVPNTKEDITEFMILAFSNIDIQHKGSDVVIKAWISKMEQVYQKAKLSFGNTAEFAYIEKIYNDYTIKEKKHSKIIIYRIFANIVLLAVGIAMMIFGSLKGEASGNPDSAYHMLALLGFFPIMAGGLSWLIKF